MARMGTDGCACKPFFLIRVHPGDPRCIFGISRPIAPVIGGVTSLGDANSKVKKVPGAVLVVKPLWAGRRCELA